MRKLAYLVTAVGIAVGVLVALYVFMHVLPTSMHRALIPSELRELIESSKPSLRISSSFSNWSSIPRVYTCDGVDTSPPITVSNIPSNSKCIELIMYDPDAPRGTFYHWLLYNVKVNGSSISIPPAIPHVAKTRIGLQGINSFGFIGYGGPCPPRGSSHRYVILVIALKTCPSIPPGASITQLIAASKNNVISYGVLVGIYSR